MGLLPESTFLKNVETFQHSKQRGKKNMMPFKHIAFTVILCFVLCDNICAVERPLLHETLINIRGINAEMKNLCNEFLPTKSEEFLTKVKELQNINEDIAYLLDESNQYFCDKNYTSPLSEIQAQRAAAFLHAWAIFTIQLKKHDHKNQFETTLSDLLTIYGQIFESVRDNDMAPLITCLPLDKEANITLKRKNLLSVKLFRETIPTTSELIGTSSDEIENNGVYTTLWTIANYKNDKRDNQTDGEFDWLKEVTDKTYPLYQFAKSAETEIHAFQSRLEKLNQYYTFRSWIANENNIEKLMIYLNTKIADGQTDFNIEQTGTHKEVSEQLSWLKQAATPDEKEEFLTDAAIWLRYILLVSYQGLGGEHIMNNQSTNIEKVFLENVKLPLFFEEKLQNNKTSPRWNHYPAQGTFNRLVSDVTCGFLDMAEFQLKDNTKDDDLTIYQKKQDTRIWKKMEDDNFTKQAKQNEVERIKNDYNDFVKMNKNLYNFHKAQLEISKLLEENRQFNRFYNPAQQFEQLAVACPELAGCSPFMLPNRTYGQYKEQLIIALNDLEDYRNNQKRREKIKQEYVVQRLDRYSLQMETITSELLLQALELAKHQADIELQIADANKKIMELRSKATGYKKSAAENRVNAQKINQELAKEFETFAKGQIAGTKLAIEMLQKEVKNAIEKFKELGDLLDEAANRWQNEINNAKKYAKVFGIVKAAVGVVAAVLAPYTGGSSLVICGALCRGLDTYMATKHYGLSDADATLNYIQESFNLATVGYTIYTEAMDKKLPGQQRAELQKLQEEMLSEGKEFNSNDSEKGYLLKDWLLYYTGNLYSKDKNLPNFLASVAKELIELKKQLEDPNSVLYQLKAQQTRPNIDWTDVSNVIGKRISNNDNKEIQQSDGKNFNLKLPIIDNEDLRKALWNVYKSGGILWFSEDNSYVAEVLNNEIINDKTKYQKKFIDNLEKIFKLLNFDSIRDSEDIYQEFIKLGYTPKEYENNISDLKTLLSENQEARECFWANILIGTVLLCMNENENDNETIFVLNTSLAEHYVAGMNKSYNDTIQPVFQKIEHYNKLLTKVANEAKTPDDLKKLVDENTESETGNIRIIVCKLNKSLQSLDNILTESLRNYNDAKRKHQIEESLFYAAVNDLYASQYETETGKTKKESAELNYQRMEYQVKEMDARLNAERFNHAAKQAQLASAEYQLRNAYRMYVLSEQPEIEEPKQLTLVGTIVVNPLVKKKDKNNSKISEPEEVSVPEVLISEVCRNYCGLLQWLNLFNIKDPKTKKPKAKEHFDDLLQLLKKRKNHDIDMIIKTAMNKIQTQIENSVNAKNVVPSLIDAPVDSRGIKMYPNCTLNDFADDPEFIQWFQSNNGAYDLPIARIDFNVSSDNDNKGQSYYAIGNATKDQFAWNHDLYNYIELVVTGNRYRRSELKYSLKIPVNNRTRTNGVSISKDISFTTPEFIVSENADTVKNKFKDDCFKGLKINHEIYGVCGLWRFYIFTNNSNVSLDERINEIKKMNVRIPILRVAP
jgi:hypothetical protein